MPCTSPKLFFQHKFVKQRLKYTGRVAHRTETGIDPYATPAYLHYSRLSDWKPLTLPCCDCTWCRLQNAREKAVRVFHESLKSKKNIFLTLTYNPASLPKNGSYDPTHVTTFVKDLRAKICRDSGCRVKKSCKGHCPRIKTFGCAEYGDKFARPHFHLIIFNYQPDDMKFWRMSGNDWSKDKNPVFISKTISDLWPYGFHDIGTVTYQSAAYVARYVSKKVKGDKKAEHYGDKLPERSICISQGIGLDWMKKHASELLANDFVLVKKKKMKLPRYYSKKLEKLFPSEFLLVKERRIAKIKTIDLDSTKKRLKDAAFLQDLKFKRLKRGYESAA